MIGINVPIPVPMAYYSFGGWKDSLFGDKHIHGPEGVSFYTRAKVVTSRWPHVEHAHGASYPLPDGDLTAVAIPHAPPTPTRHRPHMSGRHVQERKTDGDRRRWRSGVLLAAAACSSSGGKEAEESAAAITAGQADTPRDHDRDDHPRAPGDTFWDIIRKGAEAAAAKDNVDAQVLHRPGLRQAGQPDPERGRQQGRRHRGHPARPAGAAGRRSRRRSTPASRWWRSTPASTSYADSGALMYFGSDETRRRADRRQAGRRGGRQARALRHPGAGQVAARGALRRREAAFRRPVREDPRQRHRPAVGAARTIEAKLKQDPSIDYVLTLGAPIALNAVEAIKDAGSKAKVGTFDFNPQIPPKIKSGELSGPSTSSRTCRATRSIDAIWLYKNNGNVLGGGKATLTGPSFVDKTNIDVVGKFAAGGTR